MSSVSPICVDAGILVRLLTAQDDGSIRGVWGRWQVDRRTLIGPRLLRYEVADALHRMRGAGALSEEATKEAMQTTLDLPVVLADEPDLHLAATTDRRLANRVRPVLPWVRLVGE